MNKLKKISKIVSCIILGVFLLTGVLFTILVIHELSHKVDYKNSVEPESELCILTSKEGIKQLKAAAYYSFVPIKDIAQIKKYTEIKAYFVSLVIIVLFIFSWFIYLNSKLEGEW